jgi:plasmid stabilization system protein ParE
MRLVLTRPALADLAEIQRFIAQDSVRAAEAFMARLDETIQKIHAGELNGRETRLGSGRRAHGWPVPPYRIYYRRTANQTLILRVYHQARRPIEG